MKIKMKKKWAFAEDGHTLLPFAAGWVGEVSRSCADSALQEKVAEVVDEKAEAKAKAEAEQKAREEADAQARAEAEQKAAEAEANKSLGNAPQNK